MHCPGSDVDQAEKLENGDKAEGEREDINMGKWLGGWGKEGQTKED